jgi:PiT family inorganic phosphate transporter
MSEVLTVGAVIGVALIFDFLNGVHDAANSIATVVSTRVLSPRAAVAWAAFFNFIAYLVFPLAVAKTIGKGVVVPDAITLPVVTAGLIGAIFWNILTWWAGIPSSSSHALVGGFAGAAVAFHGLTAVKSAALLKIGAFIVIAPVMGMVLGFSFMVATFWIFRRWAPAKVGRWFHRLQLLSAAAYSLGHGGNDAQKTMGIIFAVLLATSPAVQASFGFDAAMHEPPMWVVYACHAAMGLGTLLGGWRIVKTMGQKICKLQPVHGFSAESAGALMLYGATWLGIPVSTTHTITGSILGVGSTRGLHAVKWGVATRVVWAWVLTIPAAALVSAGTWWVFDVLGWK